MIIVDLDGTLADCEHRRHFVDVNQLDQAYWKLKARLGGGYDAYSLKTGEKWTPDWPAFFAACSDDKPIEPVISLLNDFIKKESKIQIWSGRCESVREKTMDWLSKYINLDLLYCFGGYDSLKMRPIGDYTPDEVLFENWLQDLWPKLDKDEIGQTFNRIDVDFAFSGNPAVTQLFRRRGIFVFDVSQGKGEF